jgi:hypothetical protein
VHRACAEIPDSWEDLDMDDDRLRIFSIETKICGILAIEDDWDCSPKRNYSVPARMVFNQMDKAVRDFETMDYG